MRIKKFILFPFAMFLVNAPLFSQYQLEEVFTTTAFSRPLEMVDPGDGTPRMFVLNQRGIINVLNTDNPSAAGKVFLNISDKVSQSGLETGLLGIAFHPDYASNGYFYLYYSADGPTRSIIARYQVSTENPDSAIKGSEFVILTLNQSVASHFGGHIEFGPDNFLYISFGMGAGQSDPPNNAQNLNLLQGKIIRIDVNSQSGGLNYSIPSSNPFSDSTSSVKKEIYAWGFRNVWKFSFDNSGRLWAADVGQFIKEEIDWVEKGKNYGWRIMEGTLCFNPPACDTTGLVKPVYEYDHNSSGGTSVTGGYVSTSVSLPSLTGKYVFGDYTNGKIWALTYEGVPSPVSELLMDSPYQLSSFGKDKDGNIYICSMGNNKIYKLKDLTTNIEYSQSNPDGFDLFQNYPNPFNPATKVVFRIPESGFVTLKVFDINGKEITTLINGNLQSGEYSYQFSIDNYQLSSGIYFYTLQAGKFAATRRMVVVK